MALSKFSIINEELADYLWLWSGGDGVIDYYIFEEGSAYLDNSIAISTEEASFIRSLFSDLSETVNLDFVETDNFLTSDIDIATVSYYSGLSSGYLGVLYSDKYTGSSETKFVATWLNDGSSNITDTEKEIITHEIGHALGLDHPHGDGSYSGATSSDTVMSYRDYDPDYGGFTDIDIAALQHLWGAADDQSIINPLPFNSLEKDCLPSWMSGGYFPEACHSPEMLAASGHLTMTASEASTLSTLAPAYDNFSGKECDYII